MEGTERFFLKKMLETGFLHVIDSACVHVALVTTAINTGHYLVVYV